MYIVQLGLLVIYILVYFLSDKNSVQFLNKLKYLIFFTVMIYFFVLRQKDGGYWGVADENIFLSDISIFAQSFFLLYILVKVDRLSKTTVMTD